MPGINPALLRWARETAALLDGRGGKEDPAGPVCVGVLAASNGGRRSRNALI